MFKFFKKMLSDLFGSPTPIQSVIPTANKGIKTPIPIKVVDIDRLKKQLLKSDEPTTESLIKSSIGEISKSSGIVVLPFDDHKMLERLTDEHQDVMFKYIMSRLEKAISMNLPSVEIFRFKSSNKTATISKNNYESQLNDMMKYYVLLENYEQAGNCRDLIRQLKVNDAVDQQR